MNVQAYLKTYTGKVLEDWGSVVSEEFKKFSSDFRSVIKAQGKKVGAELKNYRMGHYDMSGFFERNGKFVYFSYSPARRMPINPWDCGAMNGILIRTAEALKDFRGGMNHFTDIEDFQKVLDSLLGGAK